MCLKALYLFRLKIRVSPAPITFRFRWPRADTRMLPRRWRGTKWQHPLAIRARANEIPVPRHDDGNYWHPLRSLVGLDNPTVAEWRSGVSGFPAVRLSCYGGAQTQIQRVVGGSVAPVAPKGRTETEGPDSMASGQLIWDMSAEALGWTLAEPGEPGAVSATNGKGEVIWRKRLPSPPLDGLARDSLDASSPGLPDIDYAAITRELSL